MILKYPNAQFQIFIQLDMNEVVMTLHRMAHRISNYETVIINIERFKNKPGKFNTYTLAILTSTKHLTAKEISKLFDDAKINKRRTIYGPW